MIITHIKVEELFGLYDYDFPVHPDLSIIHCLNGMGKTTILKLIKATLSLGYEAIDSIPFKEFSITLNHDNKDIIVTVCKNNVYDKSIRTTANASQGNAAPDAMENYRNEMAHINVADNNYTEGNFFYKLNAESITYELHPSYNTISNSFVPVSFNKKTQKSNYLFLNAFCDILDYPGIKFIEANRITSYVNGTIVNTVPMVSEALKKHIQDIRRKESKSSRDLDNEFQAALIDLLNTDSSASKGLSDQSMKEEHILQQYFDLLNFRNKLYKLGIFGQFTTEEEKHFTPDLPRFTSLSQLLDKENTPNVVLTILNSYLQTMKKKYLIYEDLVLKLDLLFGIINDRCQFANKRILLNDEDELYFEYIDKHHSHHRIGLDDLSSGEKNNLILFYNLIFEVSPGSLVIIDEPEISMHIVWQNEFLNQLMDIRKTNHSNMQVIIATHSPDIVGDYHKNCIQLRKDVQDE